MGREIMSEPKPFHKLNSENYEIQRLQERIEVPLDAVTRSEVVSGQLLEDLELTSTFQEIDHKLDRTLQGWTVVRISKAVAVSDDQTNNTMPTKTLRLAATADATVTLWVF